jgi:hypothetical protein
MNLKSAGQFNESFRRQQFCGLCALLLALQALVPSIPAQSNPPPATNLVSANRFLFIVETSTAIKPVAPHVLQVVGDLINSGANGQMHDGDTVGLWTFNQQVYSTLPVQIWAQSIRSQVANRIAAFMRQQPLEKSAQFDKVLPGMFGVIGASDFITVIIVSTGDGKMKGTPFDAEINALYKKNIKEMKGQRMPIVTVLQAKGGKLLRHTVNALPWPVMVPEVPMLLRPVPVAVTQPAPKAAPVAPPVVTRPDNLTFSGSNPNPIPPPTITLPAPKTIIPQPVVQPQTTPPVLATQTTILPAVTPPPPASAPAVTTPPPVEVAKIETAIVKPEPSPPPPVVTPKPTTPPAQPPPAPAPAQMPASVTATPLAPPPATEPAPSAKLVANETAAPTSAPPALLPPQNPAPNSTELASVVPEPVPRSNTLLIASIVLVIIALGLIFLMILRNRSTSGPSLITHAIANKKK